MKKKPHARMKNIPKAGHAQFSLGSASGGSPRSSRVLSSRAGSLCLSLNVCWLRSNHRHPSLLPPTPCLSSPHPRAHPAGVLAIAAGVTRARSLVVVARKKAPRVLYSRSSPGISRAPASIELRSGKFFARQREAFRGLFYCSRLFDLSPGVPGVGELSRGRRD